MTKLNDHILTRFDRISKPVSKLCVSLYGWAHWSVLDVVDLPQIHFSDGYAKETDYINQHNKMSVALVLQTKLHFPPCGGQSIFGLYAKEKDSVSHSNIYFGSDDMTLGKNKQSQLFNSSLDILKGD